MPEIFFFTGKNCLEMADFCRYFDDMTEEEAFHERLDLSKCNCDGKEGWTYWVGRQSYEAQPGSWLIRRNDITTDYKVDYLCL